MLSESGSSLMWCTTAHLIHVQTANWKLQQTKAVTAGDACSSEIEQRCVDNTEICCRN